jgi:hypothetical protein
MDSTGRDARAVTPQRGEEPTVNPTVTYESARLRQDELRHTADRHRLAGTTRRIRPGIRFPGHGRRRAQR